MALAGGGEFTTSELTSHAKTNMQLIEMFAPVKFNTQHETGVWRISVAPANKF
jgi:RNA 3'-terminal phosphate cyclase (ATP)